jgi:AcrR family transcriptional regulator
MIDLLASRRLHEVTIGELAAQAGVGYSTVSRNYPDLQTLLDEIAAEEIAKIIHQAYPDFVPTDASKASLKMFGYIHEHRALWKALVTGGAREALRAEFLRITAQIARAWTDPHGWLPADLGAAMTVSGTLELLGWWLQQEEPVPADEVASIFQRMLVAPMMDLAASETAGPAARKPGEPRA